VVHRLLEILSNCLLPTKYDGPFTDVLPGSFCRREEVMHKSLFISVERAQTSWIQAHKKQAIESHRLEVYIVLTPTSEAGI